MCASSDYYRRHHPLATLVAKSLRYSPSAAAAARTAGNSAALRRRRHCAALVKAALRTEATHSEMSPDANDARRRVITLSPEGRRILGTLKARGTAVTEATLAPLDDDERATFVRLLRKLT